MTDLLLVAQMADESRFMRVCEHKDHSATMVRAYNMQPQSTFPSINLTITTTAYS